MRVATTPTHKSVYPGLCFGRHRRTHVTSGWERLASILVVFTALRMAGCGSSNHHCVVEETADDGASLYSCDELPARVVRGEGSEFLEHCPQYAPGTCEEAGYPYVCDFDEAYDASGGRAALGNRFSNEGCDARIPGGGGGGSGGDRCQATESFEDSAGSGTVCTEAPCSETTQSAQDFIDGSCSTSSVLYSCCGVPGETRVYVYDGCLTSNCSDFAAWSETCSELGGTPGTGPC